MGLTGFEIIDEAILEMARACRDASSGSPPASVVTISLRPEGYSEAAWKEVTRAQQ